MVAGEGEAADGEVDDGEVKTVVGVVNSGWREEGRHDG